MYKIYADDTLIYDSTIEDFKIGKGSISLEINKSGSFTFSLYPDHFYYDEFIRLKTVITVYKSGKIIFRGRILNDVTDYRNIKTFTCEGELGFLQDSIIRPFEFAGSPRNLLTRFIAEHNGQVDDFKRFKIGKVIVDESVDDNDYINRSNSGYESAFNNLMSRFIDSALGGYFYITHGEDGTETIPTLNYVTNVEKVASQTIEFGVNLKNYTKTAKAEEIATAIIPLGAKPEESGELDDSGELDESGESGESEESKRITIESVNDGIDYVYSQAGVALYGWIFKTVEWDDVTQPDTLKRKAEARLETIVNQNITVELTAIDLHLLDPNIESIGVCEYVNAVSTPHNFSATLLCNKQTIDILKPDNDSYILGYSKSTFTDSNNKTIQGRIEKLSADFVTNNTFSNKIKETKSLIEQTENRIILSVSGTYVTDTKFNTEVEFLDSRITQTATAIRAEVSSTYATRDFVTQEVAKIEITDEQINAVVSGKYATNESVETKLLAFTPIERFDEMMMYHESDLGNLNSKTQAILKDLPLKANLTTLNDEIGKVYTKLTEYSTTEEMNSAINVKAGEIDLSVTAIREEIETNYITIDGVKTQLSEYATIEDMNSAISLEVGKIDLSVYAKTSELTEVNEKADDALTEAGLAKSGVNLISKTLNSYARTTEVDAKIQAGLEGISLDYYKKETVDAKIQTKLNLISLGLDKYALTEEVDTKIQAGIDGISLTYYNKTEIDDFYSDIEAIADEAKTSAALAQQGQNLIMDALRTNYVKTSTMESEIAVLENAIDLSVSNVTTYVDGRIDEVYGNVALEIVDDGYGNKYSQLAANVNKIVFDANEIEIDSAKFSLKNGALYAKSAEIYGYINADRGKIGEWDISNGALYKKDTNKHTEVEMTTIHLAAAKDGDLLEGIAIEWYDLASAGMLVNTNETYLRKAASAFKVVENNGEEHKNTNYDTRGYFYLIFGQADSNDRMGCLMFYNGMLVGPRRLTYSEMSNGKGYHFANI